MVNVVGRWSASALGLGDSKWAVEQLEHEKRKRQAEEDAIEQANIISEREQLEAAAAANADADANVDAATPSQEAESQVVDEEISVVSS